MVQVLHIFFGMFHLRIKLVLLLFLENSQFFSTVLPRMLHVPPVSFAECRLPALFPRPKWLCCAPAHPFSNLRILGSSQEHLGSAFFFFFFFFLQVWLGLVEMWLKHILPLDRRIQTHTHACTASIRALNDCYAAHVCVRREGYVYWLLVVLGAHALQINSLWITKVNQCPRTLRLQTYTKYFALHCTLPVRLGEDTQTKT